MRKRATNVAGPAGMKEDECALDLLKHLEREIGRLCKAIDSVLRYCNTHRDQADCGAVKAELTRVFRKLVEQLDAVDDCLERAFGKDVQIRRRSLVKKIIRRVVQVLYLLWPTN